MKKFALLIASLVLSSAPLLATAQDAAQNAPAKPPEHFYKLNFTLEEVNDAGKVTNSRSYVATIVTGPGASQEIRTGSRIPIATGAENGSTQFQYVDVGVNVDIRQVKEVEGKLTFFIVAEVSSLAPHPEGISPALNADPVIRQNRWSSDVTIPVGKPTIVYSADNLEDKGKMQVELTATRVD